MANNTNKKEMIVLDSNMIIDVLARESSLRIYSVKELKAYSKVFFAEKEEKLEQLIECVSSDLGVDKSVLDFSEASLPVLQKWFVDHVKFEKLPKEEYDKRRAAIPLEIDFEGVKVSYDTYFPILGAGLYFGETMLRKYPHLKWEQEFHKTVNYGFMIIRTGKIELNPFWLLHIISWEVHSNNPDIDFLKLFKIREEYIV